MYPDSDFRGEAWWIRHFPSRYEFFVNNSGFFPSILGKLQKLTTAFDRFSKFLLIIDRGYSEKQSKEKRTTDSLLAICDPFGNEGGCAVPGGLNRLYSFYRDFFGNRLSF